MKIVMDTYDTEVNIDFIFYHISYTSWCQLWVCTDYNPWNQDRTNVNVNFLITIFQLQQ